LTRQALSEQVREQIFERNIKDLLFFLGSALVFSGLWLFSHTIALIFAGIFLMAVALSLPERTRERRQ